MFFLCAVVGFIGGPHFAKASFIAYAVIFGSVAIGFAFFFGTGLVVRTAVEALLLAAAGFAAGTALRWGLDRAPRS